MQNPSFLTGANATYIAQLYGRFLRDPGAVDHEWQGFFEGLNDDEAGLLADLHGADWAPNDAAVIGVQNGDAATGGSDQDYHGNGAPMPVQMSTMPADQVRRATMDSIRALMLIRAYRVRGHLEANLDPLGLAKIEPHAELDPRTYGFTDADMDRPIFINYVLGLESATLRQIVSLLRDTYCGKIGVEFMHIQDPEEKAWIQERVESIRNHTEFTDNGKKAILDRLSASECFETFLDRKYTGTKRFGLEGGETLIPLMEQIIKRGGQLGVREIVLGLAHRGRLNVLANVMGKPYRAIFSEFQGNAATPQDFQGSGDVKYHLGTSSDRDFDGNIVHLSLTANPSHLEAVNTVVLGKCRAKQRQRNDNNRDQVLPLLLHGDAAFAGQGLVAEAIDMSELRGYRVGGCIHVVINNQIGFTTMPTSSRSGPYCSEVAKIVQAPILHVNGDDPEASVHVARIATEFRQKFKRDVVIDMFCYRRYGHNEIDEPAFTQPIMYRRIAEHPTVRKLYADQLEAEGTVPQGYGDKVMAQWQDRLEQDFDGASGYKPNKTDWLEGAWSGLAVASGDARRGATAVDTDVLVEIGMKMTEIPSDVHVNRKLAKVLENRRKAITSGDNIDWSTAEHLAFGSLLIEGTPVRLSGQDCGRGTFSQRHAVIVDQESEHQHVPLNALKFGQAPFEVVDSPLSEAGVLGFEYGYTLAEPHCLVAWEAQFGDFANGAQVIIDQFICSGESKWQRMCGLVMLLPHGYEGQGPEHSSARLERYLQLCAEDNMQVCNITTPANYFHALRRQVRRDFRKPLIIMTPKSLLRHKRCVSTLADFAGETTFHRLLYENNPPYKPKDVNRVVLCSGKVFYDLEAERDKLELNNVALLRVEQLYPFPTKALNEELSKYPKADVVWCQEEPKNMGGWTFVEPMIEEVMVKVGGKAKRPVYAGRPASASPATGLLARHMAEQHKLVTLALTGEE